MRLGKSLKARIHVTLKNGVLDPQGKAIGHALEALGFDDFREVRQGKYIEIHFKDVTEAKAKQRAEEMCAKLLANVVIENYDIEIEA